MRGKRSLPSSGGALSPSKPLLQKGRRKISPRGKGARKLEADLRQKNATSEGSPYGWGKRGPPPVKKGNDRESAL